MFTPAVESCPPRYMALLQLREVPALYQLMEKHGHHMEWPAIPYPRVGSDLHAEVDRVH